MAGVPSFHEILIQSAQAEGFPLAGALDIDIPDIKEHVERYDRWVEAGYAGAMQYLVRGRDRRADPRQVFPEAQSILCVALPYQKSPAGSQDPASGPRYARYLKGRDYHENIAEKLEAVMKRVSEQDPSLKWKVCVDTSAVLERSWAALAGLGWIGKNTLLINPKYGSYLFIGAVLLNRKVDRGPSPLPNYCGNCTRCLDSCPTKAFKGPGTLDSTRCISYWTLEKRGDLPISAEDRKGMGTWVAGCDICQEVCPFNIKPAKAEVTSPGEATSPYLNDWEKLLTETPEDYKSRVAGSSLTRVKPEQFSRNLAIALSNAGEDTLRRLRSLILKRAERESDPVAKAEWQRIYK